VESFNHSFISPYFYESVWLTNDFNQSINE